MKRCLILFAVLLLLLPFAAAAETVTTERWTISLDPTPEPEKQVVFQAGSFPEHSAEITVVLAEGETALLDSFTELTAAHLEGSTCYAEIAAYREAHPETEVTYSVTLCGKMLSWDTESASFDKKAFSASEFAALAPYLPALRKADIGGRSLTAEDCTVLGSYLGDVVVNYGVSVAGLSFASDAENIDVSSVSPKKAEEVAAVLPYLKDLKMIRVSGASGWKLEDIGLLQKAAPGVGVDYPLSEFGRNFSTAATSLTLSGRKMNKKEIDRLKAIAPYMTRCEKVIMENCGFSDKQMDELRTELAPYTEVVWRVKIGRYSCRTDAVMVKFSAGSPYLTDKSVQNIAYCHDIRYLDLGHNHLREIGFVANMPDLEVCIIAVNYIHSIKGIENCTKLEYCEFLSGIIKDISPLAACTELEHLNIGYNQVADLSPLYGLTKLKRLFISRNNFPAEQAAKLRELLPDCEINTTAHNPTSEGWRENPRYDLLREQFQYSDSHCRSAYYQDGELIYDRDH